ncbi:PREDICTED: uncharacterized protein LOC102815706 [Chrysochloris asiatica]|uniref:Uncharacterized protein LOC102815706 n=1 Tax=Chrysochloris asiatica TaxID=185453 RepID=A0A9B0TFC7_CHRAS|nr:PREDICTED: uncharacterized protein LOC102815706 [Chrysochloris asiatica]
MENSNILLFTPKDGFFKKLMKTEIQEPSLSMAPSMTFPGRSPGHVLTRNMGSRRETMLGLKEPKASLWKACEDQMCEASSGIAVWGLRVGYKENLATGKSVFEDLTGSSVGAVHLANLPPPQASGRTVLRIKNVLLTSSSLGAIALRLDIVSGALSLKVHVRRLFDIPQKQGILLIAIIQVIWGRARTQSPHYHKLRSRVSHIWGNRRDQPIRSTMDKPRPGETTYVIMESPCQVQRLRLRSVCKRMHITDIAGKGLLPSGLVGDEEVIHLILPKQKEMIYEGCYNKWSQSSHEKISDKPKFRNILQNDKFSSKVSWL